jgi:hypothetical protein
LLAFPLARRCAIVVRLLLLLLTELLRELLNLPALLGVVAPRVVHRAPRTALITTKALQRSIVGAPTSDLLFLPAFFFFLFLFLFLLLL